MPLIIKKIFSLSTLALVVALTLSAIAAWYSVVGLTAIFAAAVIPIIIMGGSLEVAKVVTTVWLHRYWDKCGKIMKTYLTGAVAVLALVTSMGIFGFLSKAHMDQGVPTGDVAAQIQLIDEKINIQKELISSERQNIEAARKTLSQMDAQLTARLDRGESEAGVERAVQIRAQQRRERSALNSEIGSAQKRIEASNQEIQKLNLEKAPIAAKFRKIEAEVGPIKYIAALIYGDNPDTATLERAVRWVIILLIFVFDPLALMLVIAAISSYKWEFVRKEEFIVVEGQGYVPLSPSERESGLDPFASVEPIGTPITKKAAVKKRLQEKFQNFAQQAKRFFQTSKEKFKKKNQNQQNQKESQQENQEEKLNELPTKLKFNQKLNIQLLKLSTKLNQLKKQSLLLKNKILKLKK